MKKEDAFIYHVYNSDHCKETLHTLKYEFSMREFNSLKENIAVLGLYKAANETDQYNEMQREKS